MFKRHKIIGYLLLVLIFILAFNFWAQVIPIQSNKISETRINKVQQALEYSQKDIIGTTPPATGDWIINKTVYITDEITKIEITGDIIISGTLIILSSSVQFVVFGKINVKQGGLLKIITSNVTVNTGGGIVVEGDMQLVQATLVFSSRAPRAYLGYDLIVKNNGTFEASQSTLNGPSPETESENQIRVFTKEATFKTSLSFTSRNTEFYFVNSDVSISKATFISPSYSLVLENTSNSKIEDSIFLEESYIGLVIKNSKNTTIQGNTFSGITATVAIQIVNSSNIILERNIVRNTRGYGLQTKSVQNITIANNTFYNNSGGFWIYDYYGPRVAIRNSGGIYFENASEVYFSNNTLHNDTIFLAATNNFSSIFLGNNNIVNNAKVVYYYNMSDFEISNQILGEIILVNCTNVLVNNVTVSGIEDIFTGNVTISHCKIENGTYGVSTLYASNVTFYSCNISGVIGNSIYNGANITFRNTRIYGTCVYNIQVNNSKGIIVKDSKIFNGVELIACYNVENTLIANSTLGYSGKDAITITDCEGVIIEKNRILYTGSLSEYFFGYRPAGILVEETGNFQISSNTILNSTGYGIFSWSFSSNKIHIILENNFISQTRTAVEIDEFTWAAEEYVIISNNTINNNEAGLIVSGIHNLVFKDNLINYTKFGLAMFSNIHNASFYNNSFKYNILGLIFLNSTNIFVTNNTFVDSLLFPFWTNPKIQNITVTETNTVNGEPTLLIVGKNNVAIVNRQIGELMLLDCNDIAIENVSTLALFAFFVRNFTVMNVNLSEGLGGLFLNEFSNVQIRKVYISTRMLTPFSGIQISNGEKINITNVYVEKSYNGILATNVTSIIISNSTFNKNNEGIWFESVSNGMIENNTINENYIGVSFTSQKVTGWNKVNENITFFNNCICNNTLSLDIQDLVSNVTFYFNNFIGNKGKSQIKGGDIAFDNGFIGNYWDDYNGTDANNDGIGDTPYLVANNYYDNYPLMDPCNITFYERYSSRNTVLEQLDQFWVFIIAILVIIAIAIALYIHRRRKPKIDIDVRALEYRHKLINVRQRKENE